jgi:hypothetical protein
VLIICRIFIHFIPDDQENCRIARPPQDTEIKPAQAGKSMLDSKLIIRRELSRTMKRIFRLVLLVLLGFAAVVLVLAAPVDAHPLAQDGTGYVFPTEGATIGYPGETPSPYEGPPQSSPTPTDHSDITPIPGTTLTPGPLGTSGASPQPGTETSSPTASRNLFGTEDAEMGGARVTPPPSETPSPSQTPVVLPSATSTPVENTAFDLNRGWFVAGILLPPLLLVGVWLINRARRSGEFG